MDTLERHLGAEAAADLRALRELERELERQGFVTQGDDGLRLTPRAVRRLGETALEAVFAQIEAAGSGDHDDRRTGAADEPTGLTRPGSSATTCRSTRCAPCRTPCAAAGSHALGHRGDPPAGLLVEDFEVVETERRTARRWRSAWTCRTRWSTRAGGGR